jgi:N-acyl-D-amino-acid deacylase
VLSDGGSRRTIRTRLVYDILIRNGLVFDGDGNPGFAADLAIADGRIAAIDPLPSLPRRALDKIRGADFAGPPPRARIEERGSSDEKALPRLRGRVWQGASGAKNIIDAGGLAVAPGFIDIKTHSDFTLPINPKAESKVRQGVTTEIIGHCGFSVAPVLPGKVELLKDYLSPSAPWLPFREVSFPDYLNSFPPTAVNAGMLVGHNTLRLMVMGMAEGAPSAAELQQMIALLEEALDAGALGLSSGLFTPPGSYAAPDEMIALGQVLARHNAGYFTHLRDESNKVLEALAEAIEVAAQCRVHVEIVHFKCSGTDNWGKAKTALAMIAEAKARGLDVDCDSYPYDAGSNPLKNLLPPWVQAGGVEAMLARLAEPAAREKIRDDIAQAGLNNWGKIPSWEAVTISISPHLPHCAGKTIAALAAERACDPIDALCDYLIADRGATRVLVAAIAEDDIRSIVASEEALVGSDGNCVAPYGVVGQGLPHPRFYGTFPRVLTRYAREQKLLPLHRAIHKMTGATARALKLKDRGLLRQNFCADIVIFDPDDFADRATYAEPHQFPSGARTTVIVNGTIVVENAAHTGALPGKVLRRDESGAVA